VLPEQTWLRTFAANVLDAKRASGRNRQRQRGPEDLSAAFADRSVDRDHLVDSRIRLHRSLPAAGVTTYLHATPALPHACQSQARHCLEQAMCHGPMARNIGLFA
jgi:hypothetical protein